MTDTNKMREEFEAWANEQGYFNLGRERSGKYKFQTAWAAWEGWQASRQAVVVELPREWSTNVGTMLPPPAVHKAIEAQGLRVGVKS